MNFYHQILREIQQDSELRKPLLSEISKSFEDRFVIAFYSNFYSEGGAITDEDVEMLYNLLLTRKNKNQILLILDSPGGDPLAAERFVKVCREFSKEYYVLVPHMAKSAATLIAFGGNKIFMLWTSELGPIDIQVGWEGRLRPAYTIIEAYEKLLEKGIALQKDARIEPILQQLANFDPTHIEWLKRIRELSVDIAIRILKTGIFSNNSPKWIKNVLKQFIDPEQTKTHGRPIYFSDISKKFQPFFDMIKKEELIKCIMEYHTRIKFQIKSQDLDKILETEEGQYVAKR